MLDRNNTPFKILGVPEICSDEDVKKAYRRLAMRWHPDRSKEENAEAEFKRIQLAYQLLRTSVSRTMVRAIIGMSDQGPPGFPRSPRKPEPVNTDAEGYQPSGQKPFDPVAYSHARMRCVRHGLASSVLLLWYELFLKSTIIFRMERMPMHMVLITPIALFLLGVENRGEDFTFEMVMRGLVVGFVGAMVSDYTSNHVKMDNRYRMRQTLNNVVGYVSLSSTACLLLSLDFVGVAFLPTWLGVDPEEFRNYLWLTLGSAAYLWFVFCVMLQQRNSFFETFFVWFWVVGLEFFYIIVI